MEEKLGENLCFRYFNGNSQKCQESYEYYKKNDPGNINDWGYDNHTVIFLDTNILLETYFLSKLEKDSIVNFIKTNKDRIVIASQVDREYQTHRLKFISGYNKNLENLCSETKSIFDSCLKSINGDAIDRIKVLAGNRVLKYDFLKYSQSLNNILDSIHSYQEKLKIQSDYWEKLKTEIEAVRSVGYENTDIVNMSEIYFKMADETVFAAEKYSEKIATKIRTIEILSAFDMLCLVILVIVQTLMAMKMAVKNKLLEHRAYTDAHTGLPNKSACKELLGNKEIISEPTACIMFDLNNLKTVNDTMGHSAGDQLILNFARLLRNVIPEKDFVGRYGGDEFMAVIYHTSQTEVEEILKCLCLEKDRLNNREDKMLIDYAYGWALSTNDGKYTIQTLLDKADSYMYENKKLCKRYRLMSEVEFF